LVLLLVLEEKGVVGAVVVAWCLAWLEKVFLRE